MKQKKICIPIKSVFPLKVFLFFDLQTVYANKAIAFIWKFMTWSDAQGKWVHNKYVCVCIFFSHWNRGVLNIFTVITETNQCVQKCLLRLLFCFSTPAKHILFNYLWKSSQFGQTHKREQGILPHNFLSYCKNPQTNYSILLLAKNSTEEHTKLSAKCTWI